SSLIVMRSPPVGSALSVTSVDARGYGLTGPRRIRRIRSLVGDDVSAARYGIPRYEHVKESGVRVIIAGGTGTLGVPIVEQLISAGHTVGGITRTAAGAERLKRLGATPILADAMDRDRLLDAVRGVEADAVVHELTALKKAPA